MITKPRVMLGLSPLPFPLTLGHLEEQGQGWPLRKENLFALPPHRCRGRWLEILSWAGSSGLLNRNSTDFLGRNFVAGPRLSTSYRLSVS